MLHRHCSIHLPARHSLSLMLLVLLPAPVVAVAQQFGTGAGPATGLSREELMRSWDIDGNGTISKEEADLARTRMRRERTEMQLGGDVDPVTGLSRSREEAAKDEDGEPEFRLPPEDESLAPRRRPSTTLPGMRAPSIAPPTIAAPTPSASGPRPPSANGPTMYVPRIDPSRPSAGAGAAGRSSGASWLSPNARGSAMTGGLRAGAPPASAGYGSGPWSDLNAARYRYAPAPVDLPRTGASGVGTSGLSSSAGYPRQTGSILLPSTLTPQAGLVPSINRPTSPRPSVAQPLAPPPPAVSLPRITAEEIGGY